ncbi:MAG: tyrosine-type recombinase/integrase, partial [Verrucomicrobia bacterium]|nr:tyrosine-type recombinase/integrase [Verrucomicrobiota bacterium]
MPWLVTYRVDGQRIRLSFPTQAAAKAKRDLLKIDFENLGTRASAIPDALRLEAVRCSGKLKPYGRTLTDAVDFFVSHLEATDRSSTIPDVVIEYIETKRASGKAKRHVDDLRSKLGRLAKAFPESMASEVSAKQIDHWLTSLCLSSRSINSYRTVLNGLFNFGIKRSYLKTNPIAGVERHNVVEEAPSILTPLELQELLSACDPRIVPFVAIGAFAGIRSAEIERLDWADIRFGKKTIQVSAKKAKSRQRRFVKICDALAEWLQPHAKDSGPVAPPNLRKLR